MTIRKGEPDTNNAEEYILSKISFSYNEYDERISWSNHRQGCPPPMITADPPDDSRGPSDQVEPLQGKEPIPPKKSRVDRGEEIPVCVEAIRPASSR
ncbi:hypothetical protein RRG08_019589 [Elysia crispata]|uniref:Uncharacterized protein n=1 Tax=Elysia crispata TaxID=231223 RepID=A0AAE1E5N1_9GAST|nr:hypothetical protein RRG08_019589 [Elysia crispata]